MVHNLASWDSDNKAGQLSTAAQNPDAQGVRIKLVDCPNKKTETPEPFPTPPPTKP